jgi:hypothetical protein
MVGKRQIQNTMIAKIQRSGLSRLNFSPALTGGKDLTMLVPAVRGVLAKMLPLGRKLTTAAILLLIVGCTPAFSLSGSNVPAERPARPMSTEPAIKTTEIISDPPGARIEVNNDYIGDAPITVTIKQAYGRFSNTTVIRALPPAGSGNYVQEKFFSGRGGGIAGEPIPSRIIFEMGLH